MSKAIKKVPKGLPKPLLFLPKFKNQAEATLFWQTHRVEDYLSQLEVNPNQLTKTLTIRLNPALIKTLKWVGREYGIGPTTLVRQLIIHQLRSIKALPHPLKLC